MEKRYVPKIVKGKISNTGLPIDGCVLTLTSWDYDKHSSYHLTDWTEKEDEAVMRTMHQEDELYKNMPIEEFKDIWTNASYEPDGTYCISIKNVEVVEVICEEHEVEVKKVDSIDYYFRISEKANMAKDEDGKPCECYTKLAFKLKKSIRECKLEDVRKKCIKNALEGAAKFLKTDVSNLSLITKQEYIDNADED